MTVTEFVRVQGVRLQKRTKLRIRERKAEDWYVDKFASVMGKWGFIRDCERDPRFIVSILSERPSVRRLNAAYLECKAAGMEEHGRGDAEGNFIFDPKNENQVQVALKVTKARKKRIVSAELAEKYRRQLHQNTRS
jgi:hypothetical protein